MKKIPMRMAGLGILLFLILSGIQAAMLGPEHLSRDIWCQGQGNDRYAAQNGDKHYTVYRINGGKAVDRVYAEQNFFTGEKKEVLCLMYQDVLYVLGRKEENGGSFRYFIRRLTPELKEEGGEIPLDLPGKRDVLLYREEERLMLSAVSDNGKTEYRYRLELPEGTGEESGASCILVSEGERRPETAQPQEQTGGKTLIQEQSQKPDGTYTIPFSAGLLLSRERILETGVMIAVAELFLIPLAVLGADQKKRILRGFVLLYAGYLAALGWYVLRQEIRVRQQTDRTVQDAGGAWEQEALWLALLIGTEYIWLIYCYVGIGMDRVIKRMEETASRRLAEINYSRELWYRSCLRFLPEKLPELLQKNSILEVEAGDHIRIEAAAALLPLKQGRNPDDESSEGCNGELALIQEACDRHNGILLADGCGLQQVRILFPGGGIQAAAFASETLHLLEAFDENRARKDMVLLHEDRYHYGVAGTGKRVLPFLFSQELDALEAYREPLRELELKLVVTEGIAERIQDKRRLRYIGYVTLHGMKRNSKLYELLDAYQEQQKKERLHTAETFYDGLELYYRNDFYLARSRFSEVLRECEEDRVARWYLFRCEKQLNEETRAEFDAALFAE